MTAVAGASPTDAHRRPYRRPALRVHRFIPGLPRVVTAHDHGWVSDVVRVHMAGQVDVVGETAFGEVALALCDLLSPDVVVASEVFVDGMVDHYLPSLLRTGARLVVVTEPMETGRCCELVERGATGIVDMDQTPADLAAAVLAVAAGGAVLPSEVAATVIGEWRMARRTTAATGPGGLTSREVEVLGAMTDGLSTKAVARFLGISLKTVENHKTRIFEKLGVHSQTQAVALVLEGRLSAAAPSGGSGPAVPSARAPGP